MGALVEYSKKVAKYRRTGRRVVEAIIPRFYNSPLHGRLMLAIKI